MDHPVQQHSVHGGTCCSARKTRHGFESLFSLGDFGHMQKRPLHHPLESAPDLASTLSWLYPWCPRAGAAALQVLAGPVHLALRQLCSRAPGVMIRAYPAAAERLDHGHGACAHGHVQGRLALGIKHIQALGCLRRRKALADCERGLCKAPCKMRCRLHAQVRLSMCGRTAACTSSGCVSRTKHTQRMSTLMWAERDGRFQESVSAGLFMSAPARLPDWTAAAPQSAHARTGRPGAARCCRISECWPPEWCAGQRRPPAGP